MAARIQRLHYCRAVGLLITAPLLDYGAISDGNGDRTISLKCPTHQVGMAAISELLN
jgi:hypothetical protein